LDGRIHRFFRDRLVEFCGCLRGLGLHRRRRLIVDGLLRMRQTLSVKI
jgi:hypothetical protein